MTTETVPCTPANLLLFANFVRDNHALFGGPNAQLVSENVTEASGVLAAYVAECHAWRVLKVLQDTKSTPSAQLLVAQEALQRAMAVVDKLAPAAP